MQTATPNFTFRPCFKDDDDGDLDAVVDFDLPLPFLSLVLLGVTITAVRAKTGAIVLLFDRLLAFNAEPANGL